MSGVFHVPRSLLARLAQARHVLVLTGSGVSAESGVPTFREAQTGLWSRFQPEELATPEAFRRDPQLVWNWYAWRRELVSQARPNAGHLALVALERLVARLTLVTQNVDGLHQSAGSTGVIEFHGNIRRSTCTAEGTPAEAAPGDTRVPPRCQSCGAMLRPDVVWFGEMIPERALAVSFAAAEACDVFLSVGTSALVYPAAGLAEVALARGACVVEVNPEKTPLSRLTEFVLEGPAGQVLPALVSALEDFVTTAARPLRAS